MTGSIKNLLVGIFILGSIAMLVAFIMFLKPTVGNGKQTLNVRFSDIGSINVGTRVLFGGKPVGEVVSMEEIKDARDEPTDELGRVYFYQLTLHIDSSVKVYNTDEICIQRSGLMGEKSIAITPKAPPKGVSPKLISDQPIYADSVDSLQNAMIDFSELAATMEEAFRQVGNWVRDNGEQVTQTVKYAGYAMDEISQTINTINESEMLLDLQKSFISFSSTFSQISNAIEQMDETQTFQNIGSMMENLKSASGSLDVAANDLAEGKGTVGRLITDDDLYLQMNAVMTKANSLMNDVNHYGVLFHLNKKWQRTRLKKISELNALESPENFEGYFQTEVDDINASMTRISMLIDKARVSPESEIILSSQTFKTDFAQLLQNVSELSDNLRLYNQQFKKASGN